MDDWNGVETVLCDLDGVIWLGHEPIPGSVDAIARIRGTGRQVLFVTNNSAAVQAENERALESVGISAKGAVVTSAMAAGQLIERGTRVLVAGGPGIVEAVEGAGAFAVLNDGAIAPEGFDAVVVGLHRDFDYRRLDVAAAAVRAGAVLIGTNTDSTYPTPAGLQPGGGAILAAIATASGVAPIVAGKPHQPMADVIAAIIETTDRPFDAGTVLMVGDRLDTDGSFARRLGCRFSLVRTGVTSPVGRLETAVDLDAADLAMVADQLARSPRTGH